MTTNIRDDEKYGALIQILAAGGTLMRRSSEQQKSGWLLLVKGEREPILIEGRLVNRLVDGHLVEPMNSEPGVERWRISRTGKVQAEHLGNGEKRG